MLMAAPPIYNCYSAVAERIKSEEKEDFNFRTIYMSPKGKVLDQEMAKRLSEYDGLVILCGHYEGVDHRIVEEIIDEEISIGDYVLTGGEIPACILVDSVARLVDGVLSAPECHEDESISCGMLEYPQYTRPYEFHGRKVPDVLISGHHANIDKWRHDTALEMTKEMRPDLLDRSNKE
jgi:tRNA (guanine37-N1)-methyltransferase